MISFPARPLFFIFLSATLAPLFAQENNFNPRAPIALSSSVHLDSTALGAPAQEIPGATIESLFTPAFLGEDTNFITSTSTKSSSANCSDHEQGNEYAFAGILEDGSIYAWGNKSYGGMAPKMPKNKDGTFKKTKSIIANHIAFTATLDDGSLLEWGCLNNSIGANTETAIGIENTTQIYLPAGRKVGCCMASTGSAFAAILDDGSLYAWGYDASAGKTPTMPKDENGIMKKACCLYSNNNSFTAVFSDQTLLTWGNLNGGGTDDSKTFSLPKGKKLQSCCSLASRSDTFAGILDDGSLFTWGNSNASSEYALKVPAIPSGKKPMFITASQNDFSVLLEDAAGNQSFLSWGNTFKHSQETKLPVGRKAGANCCVISTSSAFATILDNGAIFAWGDSSYGGSFCDQPKNREGQVIGACCIVANDAAFSATLQDRSIVTWGNYWYGGTTFYNHGNIFPADEENIYAYGTKACCLVANYGAFSTTLDDGSLLAWGGYNHGGNLTQEHWFGNMHDINVKLYARSILPAHQTNVISLVSNTRAFAALTDAGGVIKWGDSWCGGGTDEQIQPSALPNHQKLTMIASPLKNQTYYAQDQLAGIAITSNTTPTEQGEWQYQLAQDNTWLAIPHGFPRGLSDTQALTLPAGAKIRFFPAPNFIGSITPLSIKLLDVKATIAAGAFIDTTLESYADACSAASIALETTIEPAPALAQKN